MLLRKICWFATHKVFFHHHRKKRHIWHTFALILGAWTTEEESLGWSFIQSLLRRKIHAGEVVDHQTPSFLMRETPQKHRFVASIATKVSANKLRRFLLIRSLQWDGRPPETFVLCIKRMPLKSILMFVVSWVLFLKVAFAFPTPANLLYNYRFVPSLSLKRGRVMTSLHQLKGYSDSNSWWHHQNWTNVT